MRTDTLTFDEVSTANIAEQKLDIITWVNTLNDVSVLDMLNEMKETASLPKGWHLSEAERQSIELGKQDAKLGLIAPYSAVQKMYEKWL